MDAFNFSVTRKVLDSENIVDEIKEIRDGYVHDTEYSWSIETSIHLHGSKMI